MPATGQRVLMSTLAVCRIQELLLSRLKRVLLHSRLLVLRQWRIRISPATLRSAVIELLPLTRYGGYEEGTRSEGCPQGRQSLWSLITWSLVRQE